jgi:hypothetical protein
MQRLGMLRRCRAVLALDRSRAGTAVASAAVVYSDFLPAVDLAHPERPPQGRYA